MRVIPIKGEPTRFYVQSATNPDREYLVDIDAYDCIGQCACPNFTFNLNKHLRHGRRGNQFRCKHIEAARDYALNLTLKLHRLQK